ncbi:MAG: DJ-1/PfpI family protein [Desulfobacteraceae bacterium]|nr:DJ-1/PfpI family protein [Desulfobacteraceae bacterium]
MMINTGIFIYNEVEVLDFAGPFEVFTTASRVKSRQTKDAELLFNVFTIGEKKETIMARGGLSILPEYDITRHPALDLLIVPGGVVTLELEKTHIIDWIRRTPPQITASVCTGAFLLAKAGLLASKKATTHWEDIPDLEALFPDIEVKRNLSWVDEGRVVTAAGISAGIDMSLYLVSRLADMELALDTARQMEYIWNQNPLERGNIL